MTAISTSREEAQLAAETQNAAKTAFIIRLPERRRRRMVASVAKGAKTDSKMSQVVRALTPEEARLSPDVLRQQIPTLRAEAERHRRTAQDLEDRADELERKVEALERGQLPPDALRAKILALATVNGWVTKPGAHEAVRGADDQLLPVHQVERAIDALEDAGRLVRTDEVDMTFRRGRPPVKYALADIVIPEEPATRTDVVPGRRRRRTRETPMT